MWRTEALRGSNLSRHLRIPAIQHPRATPNTGALPKMLRDYGNCLTFLLIVGSIPFTLAGQASPAIARAAMSGGINRHKSVSYPGTYQLALMKQKVSPTSASILRDNFRVLCLYTVLELPTKKYQKRAL
jgi:hypothetical protein